MRGVDDTLPRLGLSDGRTGLRQHDCSSVVVVVVTVVVLDMRGVDDTLPRSRLSDGWPRM